MDSEPMRHNRLKHAADTLCHMFGGWRLSNCYEDLERLGSGLLLINVLTAECQMNGAVVKPLSIAAELHIWLLHDFDKHCIELSNIRSAILEADLQIEKARDRKRSGKTIFIAKDRTPIMKGEFVSIAAKCRSEITTDESAYRAQYEFKEAWPVGWPDR